MAQTTISSLPADCLLYIFSALPLRDLISCRRVCKTWNKLIKTKHVWKYVSFEGMRIVNWEKATGNLKKWKTKGINFSDYSVQLITRYGLTSLLFLFLKNLKSHLRHLRFGVLSTNVLDFLLPVLINNFATNLESLTVDMLTTGQSLLQLDSKVIEIEYFDIGKVSKLQQLRELRIVLDHEHVRYSAFSFNGGLSGIGNLRHLRKLCLTSLQDNSYDFSFLSNLTQLVQLQLGDATALPPEVFKLLSELCHLRQLSLYNGYCTCSSAPCQCQWVDAIGKITNLIELELDFVHTVPRLNKSLLKMKQLRSLTIVPLKTDVIPNATAFTVEDAKESTIPDVLEGLTWLRNLTWGVYCPIEAVELDQNNHMRGNSSTLTAVKERIQQCLPNTVILILPVLKTEDGD